MSIVKAAEKLHRAIGLGRIREGVRKANSIHECHETPLFIGHFRASILAMRSTCFTVSSEVGPRHVDDFAEAGLHRAA